jgi:hypothetical protein
VTTKPRLTIAALTLVLAFGLALVFRVTDTPGDRPPVRPPSTNLQSAQAEAALRPCPQAARTPNALSDVAATCLGDGRRIEGGALLTSRPALIFAWSPTCADCLSQLTTLDEYASTAGAFPVVSVLVRGDAADGLDVLTEQSVRLPTVHDDTGELSAALDVPDRLPASYLVDTSGVVHHIDARFTSPAQVQDVVDRHLALHS